MTAYQDLCKAFDHQLPRWEAIDRVLRSLPAKMKQAISTYLSAPAGSVALYQPMIDQAGHPKWEACGDDCLQVDHEGIYGFAIGVQLEKFSMAYFQFTVEEFDEKSVVLKIKNLDGSISISDAHEPASYANAAKETIERLLSDLKNPKPMRGSRAPIGFVSR